MTKKRFYIELVVAIIASILMTIIVNLFLKENGDWLLSWIAIASFTVLSVLIFYLANRGFEVLSPYAFIRIIILNVFLKIFLCFGIAMSYYHIAEPQSRFFILPFLVVYLIFTIFETAYLVRLSDSKKSQS